MIIDPTNHRSLIGAKSEEGVRFVTDYLIKKDLVFNDETSASTFWRLGLTFDGWERVRQIEKGEINTRKAFIAMQFNNKDLGFMLENFFKPAVEKTGFTLERLDEAPKAGVIDNNMRVAIQTAAFVVADLTDDNSGAYWEAGYAEGLGKEVIFLCEESTFNLRHFDTAHMQTVKWSKSNPNDAAEDLKATIRATLPHLANMEDN